MLRSSNFAKCYMAAVFTMLLGYDFLDDIGGEQR